MSQISAPSAHGYPEMTPEIRESIHALMLWQGFTDKGVPSYVYLLVPLARLDELIALQAKGEAIVPDSFGHVLAHGIGVPDEALRESIAHHYQAESDMIIDLTQALI